MTKKVKLLLYKPSIICTANYSIVKIKKFILVIISVTLEKFLQRSNKLAGVILSEIYANFYFRGEIINIYYKFNSKNAHCNYVQSVIYISILQEI